MPLSHGPDSGVLAGCWRYQRTAGCGIALSYDRTVRARRLDVHRGGRFTGRWRYDRTAARGIALSYDDSATGAPVASPAAPEAIAPTPEPVSPPRTWSPRVRVLCSCGRDFTFEGDEGICPGCGRPAAWPTLGNVEREMRSDLEELFRAHEQDADPD